MNQKQNKGELIVVEQLPIIKQYLEDLSIEIKEKVNKILDLECTEETKNEIKKYRAELNKEFEDLETKRKEVKKAIQEPYEQFLEIYDTNVSGIYTYANNQLKSKIDEVENMQKAEKTNDLINFFNEHASARHIDDIVKFDDVGLNITLSASTNSLNDQIATFCERVATERDLIGKDTYQEETLLEWLKNGFKMADAKLLVIDRHNEMELLAESKKKLEEIEAKEEEIIKKVDEVATPKEIEKIETITFMVQGTKTQLVGLREYMKKEGIIYE